MHLQYAILIYEEMLTGGRNYDYSDDERHSTLRHTPVMLSPTLHEPCKLATVVTVIAAVFVCHQYADDAGL